MRQDDVLAYLKSSDEPKSVRQICEAFGIAYPEKRTAVTRPLCKLKKWGCIRVAGSVWEKGPEMYLWEAVQ